MVRKSNSNYMSLVAMKSFVFEAVATGIYLACNSNVLEHNWHAHSPFQEDGMGHSDAA